jgi:hypothetical protein
MAFSKEFKKRVKDIIFTIIIMGGLAVLVFAIIHYQHGRLSFQWIIT